MDIELRAGRNPGSENLDCEQLTVHDSKTKH